MVKGLGDHPGFCDGGDDFQFTTTVRTVLEVDIEHPFEQTGPADANWTRWTGCMVVRFRGVNLVFLLPLNDLGTQFGVRSIAKSVRQMIGLNQPCFPIVQFMEVYREVDPNFVYDGAANGFGRDRMTIAHEYGHLFLHAGIGFAQKLPSNDVLRFCSSDWQANCFGGDPLISVDHVHLCREKCSWYQSTFLIGDIRVGIQGGGKEYGGPQILDHKISKTRRPVLVLAIITSNRTWPAARMMPVRVKTVCKVEICLKPIQCTFYR